MSSSRWKARLLAITLLLGMVGGIPLPALAACDAWADGSTWNDNCTVGTGFETNGNYTRAIQRILYFRGFYGGTIDGLWGPLSAGATSNYQASEGISSDGIVGPTTWTHLKGETVFCYVDATTYNRWRELGNNCTNGTLRYHISTAMWYMRRGNLTWQAQMNTSGPS